MGLSTKEYEAQLARRAALDRIAQLVAKVEELESDDD